MTQKGLVALLRRLIADEQATGFSSGGSMEQPEGTQELLNYLDRAVVEYSRRRSGERDPRFLRDFIPVNGEKVPDDFLFFAGSVPVPVVGGVVRVYGPPLALPARYFARLPYISAYGEQDELPHRHDDVMQIAALAAVYALNKQEYNVTQDMALLGMTVAGGSPDVVQGKQDAE